MCQIVSYRQENENELWKWEHLNLVFFSLTFFLASSLLCFVYSYLYSHLPLLRVVEVQEALLLYSWYLYPISHHCLNIEVHVIEDMLVLHSDDQDSGSGSEAPTKQLLLHQHQHQQVIRIRHLVVDVDTYRYV